MAARDRNHPYSTFNFILEIGGVDVAGFSECSGLAMETDTIEYRDGDENLTALKLSGLKKFTNITLKRGLTQSKDLVEWCRAVMDGKTDRKGGAIVLLDEAREEAVRWTFHEGWPAKWGGPALNGKTNEVAIESLELVVEGLTLE